MSPWQELIEAFELKWPWQRMPYHEFARFESCRYDPLQLWHPLQEAAKLYDIEVRPLTRIEKRPFKPSFGVKYLPMGGICLGPYEVGVAYPSTMILAHEFAHALDMRLPGFYDGPQTEGVAIAVEYLLCAPYAEKWMPNVLYGHQQGVSAKLLRREHRRIAVVYTAIKRGLRRVMGDGLDNNLNPESRRMA